MYQISVTTGSTSSLWHWMIKWKLDFVLYVHLLFADWFRSTQKTDFDQIIDSLYICSRRHRRQDIGLEKEREPLKNGRRFAKAMKVMNNSRLIIFNFNNDLHTMPRIAWPTKCSFAYHCRYDFHLGRKFSVLCSIPKALKVRHPYWREILSHRRRLTDDSGSAHIQ